MQSHIRTLSVHHITFTENYQLCILKTEAKMKQKCHKFSQMRGTAAFLCSHFFVTVCLCLQIKKWCEMIVMKQKSCSWLFCQSGLQLKIHNTINTWVLNLFCYLSVYFGINYSDVITQYQSNQLQHPILKRLPIEVCVGPLKDNGGLMYPCS